MAAHREGRAAVGDASFEVEFARSGRVVVVPPGESILDVARQAGIEPLASCTEGVCGTCETSVISGVADHRDHLLTETERERGDTILICVSRARAGRLVLDL